MQRVKLFYGTILIFFSSFLLLQNCNYKKHSGSNSQNGVPLPDPGIKGFHFPESETTIDGWLNSNDTNQVYLHGWGIWAALTMPSGIKKDGRELLVFETWLGPKRIISNIGIQPQLLDTMVQENLLENPRQFKTSAALKNLLLIAATNDTFDIKVTVNYSPDATAFAIQNRIFYKSVLDSLVQAGKTQIPDFPNTAMTLKPVYKHIRHTSLIDGKYYVLPVWPGTPEPDTIPYDERAWNSYVYVDVTNNAKGTGKIIYNNKEKPSDNNTFNLTDFIYRKIDKANKAVLQADDNDYLILVAMHVTSREITRWTWQTFWWDPFPNQVKRPTTKGVINAKPSQLKDPARHYSMSIAYTMIEPNQPLTGGNNTGKSLYVFNPYLEAGFDQGTFIYGGLATVMTDGKTIKNNVGMRTNCMSCHSRATYNKDNYSFDDGNTVPYVGDTYIDFNRDSLLKKYLKLDFAWSIQGNIVPQK